MCGRARGVDLFGILQNPGSTASHTSTICHHSYLESAAGDWTRTGCYRRSRRVLVGTGREGEAGLGPHTSRCSLCFQTGAEVQGGGSSSSSSNRSRSSTLVVGCAQAQRSVQDAEERRGDSVTHVRLSTLSLRLPLSIHRGWTQRRGRLDTGTLRDAPAAAATINQPRQLRRDRGAQALLIGDFLLCD
ncbi:unnamed protein product [Pleuronectes platessa]|uniref:Uncharacterized protein n=1 Tax=Pleuronectes platessa TaxID=8262 RepID=A0A9N7TVY6_PLEPL|nr:unnamed protein product [Pleuronectes platessa]